MNTPNKFSLYPTNQAPKQSEQNSLVNSCDTDNQSNVFSMMHRITIDQRWKSMTESVAIKDELLDTRASVMADNFTGNIERYIGTIKIPVGIAGPIKVNGEHANGNFSIPLATTEATLVASYHRGSKLITECGGCTSMLIEESLSRSPGFAFRTLRDVRCFLDWLDKQTETLKRLTRTTTCYGRLIDVQPTVEGNHVYLNFNFTTGDAAGQNMVTIATDTLIKFINDQSPVTPSYFFVEANHSGDKKASAKSLSSVRGKRVSAEVVVPAELVQRRLHTSASTMVDYWRMAAMGGVLNGTIGVQGHYANGLAALFLACGQDVACVSESAVGITRFELNSDGDLYAVVTLPSLVVGTVGGGTDLPSQNACLKLLGLAGNGKAAAFSEVCAALTLAGELSIVGALCAQEFTRAHERLARKKMSSI